MRGRGDVTHENPSIEKKPDAPLEPSCDVKRRRAFLPHPTVFVELREGPKIRADDASQAAKAL